MTVAEAAPTGSYPIRYDVAYPEHLSRWLIFVKWLLAIPQLIIIYFLNITIALITFIAFFAILFTKHYPEGLFQFTVGARRWQANVAAYIGLLRDEYPPFSWEPGQYAVTLEVDYPAELSRWLIFIKWLLIIPHIIVLVILGIVALVVAFVAWFAILLTGKYPRPLFDFSVGVQRWSERINGYTSLFTDAYPPFSMAA